MRRGFALLALLGLAGVALYRWAPALPGFVVESAWLVDARTTVEGLERDLGDARVAAGVRTALALNRSLKPSGVEVAARDATVSLRGEVASQELRAAAERIAAAVPGVRGVANDLVVRPPSFGEDDGVRGFSQALRDGAIELRTRLAFSLNRELAGTAIEVHAFRGQLRLAGVVDAPPQRQVALAVAREIPGAGDVVDGMQLRSEVAPVSMDREPLATLAEQALAANTHLAGHDIAVRPEGGRLVLEGSVHTALERDLAGLLAEREAGRPVDNRLELRP